MPGRAGAEAGGGGAQHTPLHCPGLCYKPPWGEASLSGQAPAPVASACLRLLSLCPLSSVMSPCVFRCHLQASVSHAPARSPQACAPPSGPRRPCFSSRCGEPGAGRPRAAQRRRDVGDAGAPGPQGLLGCVQAQAVAGCAASLCAALQRLRPAVPAAQAALLPSPCCSSPSGQGHAGPRKTATTVECRSPGRGVGLAAWSACPFRSESSGTVGRGS